jgi:hypothetical protein
MWISAFLPVSAWLVRAERVGVGPDQDGRVRFIQFSEERRIWHVRYGFAVETLPLTIKISTFQLTIHIFKNK